MSKYKNLKQSLAATMAGIASRAGLKIAFGAPRTDGKTVWVTDVPLNPTDDDYHVVVGDLGHEVAHIKWTDFSLDRGEGLLAALTNVFEDVRIERLLEREFLGMKHYLDESYKIVQRDGSQGAPDSPANALTMFLLTKYMIDVNQRTYFEQNMINAKEALINHFQVSDELVNKIVQLCDPRVPVLKSTADVISLSKDVIALLEQEQEPEQEQPSNDNAQNDSSSDDSGSDDSGSDDSGSDDSSSDDSQQEGSSGSKELLDSEVDEGSPISLRELADSITKNVDSSQSTKALMGQTKDLAQELKDSNGGFSKNNFVDIVFSPDLPTYNLIKSNLSADISILRKGIVRYWQNEVKKRDVINEHDGRFDASEAIRCMTSGDANFLVKRGKRVNNKPAVCILGDLSGSMDSNDFFKNQTETMIALVEACDQSGIPLNVLGFSDDVVCLKRWQDPIPKARAMIGGQELICGTRIMPAVYEGIRALNTRKESKKILIVMTDGRIGSDEQKLKQLIKHVNRYSPNIEIYGLGLGVDLGSVFSKGGRVNQHNMAEAVLSILAA